MSYDGTLKFDTKVDQGGFEKGMSTLKSTALGAISVIGAAISTGAIAKALAAQVKAVSDYGSTVNDMSQKIGISTAAYQKWSYVLGQTGTDVAVLQTGMKTLSSAVVDGNKAFDKLGISLEEARAMSTEDLFEKVITQLAGMEAGTERTALMTDLFGRSATELLPVLNAGASGIEAMKKQAEDYGLIMSDSAVKASDDYGDAVELATRSSEGLRNAIVAKLLPALTNIVNGFSDISAASATALSERGLAGVADVITDRFPVATAVVSGLAAAFAALLIIQTLTKVMKAFQEAQLRLTLALMGTTAAAVAESATLTLTEVIVGIFTGKLKGAAAAQALLNATIKANPVMLLVTAIGLLVGGMVLLIKQSEKANQEIEEAHDRVEALTKSMKESASAYKATTDKIDSQKFAAEGLIDTLEKMSREYSGSNVEQAKMQSICDTLNSTVDGLSVTFDSNTGALSMNAEAIRDVVAAQYEAATASAALARYQELVTEKFNADYALQKARDSQPVQPKMTTVGGRTIVTLPAGYDPIAAAKAYNTLTQAEKDALAATDELDSYGAYLESIGVSLVGTTAKTEDFTASTEEAAETTERAVVAGYDITNALDKTGMSADDAAERLSSFTGVATNMFERINTKSQLSVKQMIANLTANTLTMEKWGTNIALLGEKLPTDLLQPLIDQGPEKMAGVIDLLANTSDEELATLVDAFAKGGDAAKQAWLASIGAGTTSSTSTESKVGTSPVVKDKYLRDNAVTDAATNIVSTTAEALTASGEEIKKAAAGAVTSAKEAMSAAVEDADFGEIAKQILAALVAPFAALRQKMYDTGRNFSMGFIIGMLSRKAEIIADAIMLAKAANDAFNDFLEVKSPSKKAERSGGYFGGGFIIGLFKQREPVRRASQEFALASLSGLNGSLRTSAGITAYGSIATKSTTQNTTPTKQNYGIEGGVSITVEGVVESDAQLSRRIASEFEEVLYGRKS